MTLDLKKSELIANGLEQKSFKKENRKLAKSNQQKTVWQMEGKTNGK